MSWHRPTSYCREPPLLKLDAEFVCITRPGIFPSLEPPLLLYQVMETHHPPSRPSCRDDFEIAIICALPLEYEAVSTMFDGHWNDDGDLYGKVYGDPNTYATGWIGRHNVVLTLLLDIGKVAAASAATSFSLSYTRVQLALLVGVCGGVPQTSDGVEIFLGDVVVSQQLVQYDFGRRLSDRFRRKNTFADGHSRSPTLHGFMKTIQTDRYLDLLPKIALKRLMSMQARCPGKYDHLNASEDKLFRSEYRHKHRQPAGCAICNQCTCIVRPTCDVALTSTCQDLKCDDHELVYRRRLDKQNEPTFPSATLPRMSVHFGAIASGDSVMKSAADRDEIAETHNVIAFEMEGAGVFTSLPCLVIKGVCDYSDSHKDKRWQNYVAAIATCVMKTLLMWYPSANRTPTQAPNELTECVGHLQHTKHNLQDTGRELKAQIQFLQSQLPAQVRYRNIVVVNDASGETYSFSLNWIDSFEVCHTLLRRLACL